MIRKMKAIKIPTILPAAYYPKGTTPTCKVEEQARKIAERKIGGMGIKSLKRRRILKRRRRR